MRRLVLTGTVLLLLLILWLSASAALSHPPPQSPDPSNEDQLTTPQLIEAALAKGEIDRDTANLYLAYALADYESLPAQYHSHVPWDGTLPFLRLQEAVQKMEASSTRTTIERLLQSGNCGGYSSAWPTSDSTNFHIEYGTIGGGLSITEYTNSLETAWTTEVSTFGWAAPPVLTGNPPPGNRYHVRIDALGGGLYGFVTAIGVHAGFVGDNPNTPGWNEGDAWATCMVLNSDYSAFPGTAQQALDATTAHEFNHSIQFGYGALTGANAADDDFVEGGATWMEDEVFDSANDNYNYLWPTFSMCMGQYTASPYPYWITWRGLTERYGTGTASGGEQVMQDFWEETSKGSGDNLSAMSTALVNKGTTLADAYHAYAIAVKFNKTCGGSYVSPYCFEEAAGYVGAAGATSVHGTIATVGTNYNSSIPDNYALNWVSLPTSGGPYPVGLQNTSTGGQLRGSVVCDTGSALNITAFPSVVGAGSSSSITSFDPSGCTSVVAVITNQAQTANNPTSCTAHSYLLRTDSVPTPTPIPTGSTIYLPLILRNYPPTGPRPGFWESATGDEFYVTTDRAYVDDFAIYISVSGPGCGSYKITHTPQEPITNDQFSFTGPFYASGTFDSATQASGTDGLDDFPISGCGSVTAGPWSWSATWQNDSQPRFLPAEVVEPDRVEPVEAVPNFYTVTPVQ